MRCHCGKIVNHVGPCKEVNVAKEREEGYVLGKTSLATTILTATIKEMKKELGEQVAISTVVAAIINLDMLEGLKSNMIKLL